MKESEGTFFPNKKMEYRYNKSKGTLEEVNEIDLQEQINSCVQPTVDELFDKLLYTREEKELNNNRQVIREYEDRLDLAQNLQDTYNDLVSKLGLSDGVSFAEIQSVIQNNLVNIQGKISEKEKVEKGKEVITNETKVVEESKQETL